MVDEIKEILDFKENADYKRLSCDEIKVLRDYITNLQEERDSFEKELDEEDITYYIDELLEERRINQEDLKYIDELNERIEKAVEELELWKPKNKVIQLEIELLLNILRGDKE